MAQKKRGKKEPNRRKAPERRNKPCRVLRIGLIVGNPADTDLDGAEDWILQRARVLGGSFRLWRSRSSSPLDAVQDNDITGGTLPLAFTVHREGAAGNDGYGGLLADCGNCRGRVEELVIFHHGSNVNERDLGAQLVKIFRAIQVPVCRIVWWACNAEVALQVGSGQWTDLMMRQLGQIARCRPCGCEHPIELVWPTAGRCHLTGPGADDLLQTNDGKVNKARWGYRWADGNLHTGYPPSTTSTIPVWPPDRDPPHDQPLQPQGGSVLGADVGRKP